MLKGKLGMGGQDVLPMMRLPLQEGSGSDEIEVTDAPLRATITAKIEPACAPWGDDALGTPPGQRPESHTSRCWPAYRGGEG